MPYWLDKLIFFINALALWVVIPLVLLAVAFAPMGKKLPTWVRILSAVGAVLIAVGTRYMLLPLH